DRHAPAVVAGACERVPGAGVACAVVKEIELGVVREPAPRGAAAEPPLLAFPGVEARVAADRLAEMRGALGIDEELLVGADAVRLLGFFARVDVVSDDEAAHAVLPAADAGDYLV